MNIKGFTERLKLQVRAWKYKTKHDKGGVAYIRAHLKQGHTVLDVGAHKGGYLFWILRQIGPDGRVVALEPQSRLYQYLCMLKSLLGWEQATIAHLAPSDTEGQTTLYIPIHRKGKRHSSPGAAIVSEKAQDDNIVTETVNTQTLDAYCAEHGLAPDLLKIDVEGNELRVFRGGEQTLLRHKPRILVEIEARHVGADQVRETFDCLAQLGYRGYFIKGASLLPSEEFSIARYQNAQNMQAYCNNFVFE